MLNKNYMNLCIYNRKRYLSYVRIAKCILYIVVGLIKIVYVERGIMYRNIRFIASFTKFLQVVKLKF